MLTRLVITFLRKSKCLLISWLQSPSAVILEPKNIKSDTVSTVSPSISHEVMGPDAMIFIFWMLSFKPTFSLSSFHFHQEAFSSSSLSAIRVVSSAYLRFPSGSDGKASACNAWDPGSIPGSGRSPGEGNGNPLQYPCLKNSMNCCLRSLVGNSPWSRKESDTTERLHMFFTCSHLCIRRCLRLGLFEW